MAATATKLRGPTSIGGLGHVAIFSVLLDNSMAVGGEAIDLTAYFSEIDGIAIGGVDDTGDGTWRYTASLPSNGTAITSSNVLIMAHHGSGADAVDNPADAEDLSTVGELRLIVFGKAIT